MAEVVESQPPKYEPFVLPARSGVAHVWKAFRYRLYPTDAQKAYFERLFGCCRFVWNHYLEVRIAAWQAKQANPEVRIPTRFDMTRDLTRLKRETRGENGEQFLREVDATALTNELAHLDAAFSGFFGRVAKRKVGATTQPAGFPRFKSRQSKRAATVAFPNVSYIGANRIRFAKVGWVRANVHRPIEGVPVSLTVSEDSAGRWWASIKCRDAAEVALAVTDAAIGLSIGVPGKGPLIVTSDGEVFDCACDEDERRIARERRRLTRREGPERGRTSSKRYEKQRLKLAKLYAKGADHRKAEINKLTSALVERYDTIVCRWCSQHEVLRQLRYKCEWKGRAYVELPFAQGVPKTAEERVEQAKRDLKEGLALLGELHQEEE